MVGWDMRESDFPSSAHCFKSSSDFGLHTCHIEGLSMSWNIVVATIIDQVNHFGQSRSREKRLPGTPVTHPRWTLSAWC